MVGHKSRCKIQMSMMRGRTEVRRVNEGLLILTFVDEHRDQRKGAFLRTVLTGGKLTSFVATLDTKLENGAVTRKTLNTCKSECHDF